MPEQLKQILDKAKEWWNKFTTKQKTLIITVAAAAIMTMVILITVLTQPNYVVLITATDAAESAEIKELFDGNSIDYKISDDALVFRVLDSQQTDARLLLASNGVQADDYSIDSVTESSFSTTESDKQKKYVAYLEKKIASDLKTIDAIDDVKITLHVPEDDGTLIASQEESSASVLLKLTDPEAFTDENAMYVAKIIQVALGNDSTENIMILDTSGNMLFSGESEDSIGVASTQLSLKQKAEQSVKSAVRNVILGTEMYDNVEVAPNLSISFSTIEDVNHTYTPVDGGSQGVLSSEKTYSSETSGGESGTPGTDSNDDTTYVTEDSDNYSSTTSEKEKNYLPNERITTTSTPAGAIDYDESSIAVSAINYIVMNESDYVSADHDNLTWDEYKLNNSEPTDVTDTIDEASLTRLQNLVANASGMSTDNITVALYTQNVFFDAEGLDINITDVLQIVLILIILALLAFVIIRSLQTERQEEVEDEPEELSVEQLLESQPDEELEALENIEMDEGSETKKLIEAFVDANPEAAANLLRNWLNEDYS